MNEVIIGAIAGGIVMVLASIGKIIVDVIRAKKEPDQADMELKDELQREKDKNNAAIEQFTAVAKELKNSVEETNKNLEQRFTDMDQRFTDMEKQINTYRDETREINKSELRHSITQIYFQNLETKTLDLRTKDDLCSLYAAYSSIGGNSFAHELYEEMMTWQVK